MPPPPPMPAPASSKRGAWPRAVVVVLVVLGGALVCLVGIAAIIRPQWRTRGGSPQRMHDRRESAENARLPPKPMRPLVRGVDYFSDYDIDTVAIAPTESLDYRPYPQYPRFFEYANETNFNADFAMKYISNAPRVLYIQDFMTPAECDEIIGYAKPQMQRSVVVPHKDSHEPAVNEIRTSSQAWLGQRHGGAVNAVIDRILAITGFTLDHAEPLQVLRYEANQKYDAHNDYFDPKMYGPQKNNRAVTVFLYLSDVEEGGETQFPRADGKGPTFDYTSCTRGLRVRPRKGQAALFYDMKPNGELDPSSLHGGCPVKKGVKWGGTLWLRVDHGGESVKP